MDFGSYGQVLAVHSTLRWVVLAAGFVATAASWAGRLGSKSWVDTTAGAGRVFAVAMDLQLVAGLVLYLVLSPAVTAGLANIGAAMEDRHQRFWMAEHPAAMILALVLAHIGALKSRQAAGAGHRQASWYFTLAFLLIVAALPWPFRDYGRPLMPNW
jgi:uncharacterized Tic20 family protein